MLIGPTVTASDIKHARFKGKIPHTHQTLKRVDHSELVGFLFVADFLFADVSSL